uniref:mucin-5AC-like isoform X2 n=1 Tax=Ciona intestinalis TaxID=7719 RepID=UPI00089DBAF7|nr:mucin-5AC-like isoform X2 [Ciona intestinalis]|eukprot:XP_018669731.1 mucin-5AC-like isoform X2 [Ciona intestinalis]
MQQQQLHYQGDMLPQYNMTTPMQTNQLPDNYFTHPPPPRQMPPPPSYPNSMQVKGMNQQQYQMPYQSQPSPLNLDDLTSPISTSMTSPSFGCHTSVTPPLVGIHGLASPVTPNAPSPMYTSLPSPMNPPMNTPQPLPITSPMHPAMTPPLTSPAPRKGSVSRRASRQKSNSIEATTSIDMQDLTDIGFNQQFDVMNTEDMNNPMAFTPQNPGVSPGHNVNYMQRGLVSPVRTQSMVGYHTPLQHQHSNNRSSNFPFDQDMMYDNEFTRSNPLRGKLSNPPSFMPPMSAANINAENSNEMKVSEMFDEQEMSAPPSYHSSQPISGQNNDDTDVFTFDDNKPPSKISMPDQQQRNKQEIQQRMATSTPALPSQQSHDITTKPVITTTSNIPAMHKPLVRQNAMFKGSSQAAKPTTVGQTKLSDGKERKKKGSTKDDGKAAPRRRGRPPSIDKKEHSVKRKKVETFVASSEDNEVRPKIVLNVQLNNKGVPISSITKTKPVPPETPPQPEKVAPVPATTSSSKAVQDLQGFPADFQRYLNNQAEMHRKKKEKKLVTGSLSPITTQSSKNNGKAASGQSNTAVIKGNAPSGSRNQFTPIKSASVSAGSKSNVSRPVPSGPPSPQPKQSSTGFQTKGGVAGVRHRKSSIIEVVDMLHAGQAPGAHAKATTPTATTAQRTTGSVLKSYDRQQSSSETNSALKLKPTPLTQGKTSTQSTTAVKLGGKSPAGGSSGKSSVAIKQVLSKSPSFAAKHGTIVNRANTVRKESKQKSIVVPVSKSPPKNTALDPKMKLTLSKIQEFASAQTFKPMNVETKQTRPAILRPSSGGKSPGRTPTPPQNRAIHRSETLQALLKGRKSPSHAAVPSMSPTENLSSRPSSSLSVISDEDDKMSSKTAVAGISPFMRKQLAQQEGTGNPNRIEPVATGPIDNPGTPENKLVIDDAPGDKFVAVQQDVPSTKHVLPPTNTAPASTPVLEAVAPSADFTMSPSISDNQCLPDDDLMNAAVS